MDRPAGVGRTLLVAWILVVAGCAGTLPAGDTPAERPASPTGTPAEGTLSVHFINVGQSVSTLVVGPTGETMLIDTGHYNDDGEYVLDYLRAHDIERIDHLVVSHNDADHIGGNAAVIDYYETEADGIGAVHDPGIAASTQTYGEYLDAVEAHDVTLYETRAGDSIGFEGVQVRVLGPPEPYIEDRARNENSIVLKLTYGRTSFLSTGDAEDDQEAYLVSEYGDDLRATVLKAGHHGSSTSTSGELLDAVRPQAVVISSAYDSQYGHPHEETLQRLADRSIRTYWTATHGDTVLVSDGQRVVVGTQADAPTDPLSLRAGEPVASGEGGGVEERTDLDGESGGTSVSTATPVPVEITQIHADAAGDDRENLNDEYVVFRNTGDATVDLSGWTVSDEVGKTYTFPDGATLGPGESVTLHTGAGDDNATHRYWGADGPVWNNDGDTVTLRNSEGVAVRTETYG